MALMSLDIGIYIYLLLFSCLRTLLQIANIKMNMPRENEFLNLLVLLNL